MLQIEDVNVGVKNSQYKRTTGSDQQIKNSSKNK